MTRFSITMDEALGFILKAVKIGKGSEIFVPKLKAYSIMEVKQALNEILGDHGEEVIGIRPGEKLHETLINKEEMRYAWEYEDLYIITPPLNPMFHPNVINETYNGIKKIKAMTAYSSDQVDRISISELKDIIKNSQLV